MATPPVDDDLDDVESREMLDKPCENDFASALMTINSTMLTMGESLKRLHEQQDMLRNSAEFAKFDGLNQPELTPLTPSSY